MARSRSSLRSSAGQAVFSADDGVSGRELWRTVNSAAGAVSVDVNPGPDGSFPSAFVGTEVGGTPVLFFYGNDGTAGYELHPPGPLGSHDLRPQPRPRQFVATGPGRHRCRRAVRTSVRRHRHAGAAHRGAERHTGHRHARADPARRRPSATSRRERRRRLRADATRGCRATPTSPSSRTRRRPANGRRSRHQGRRAEWRQARVRWCTASMPTSAPRSWGCTTVRATRESCRTLIDASSLESAGAGAGGFGILTVETASEGREPWVSTGIAASTTLLSDIFPGPAGSEVLRGDARPRRRRRVHRGQRRERSTRSGRATARPSGRSVSRRRATSRRWTRTRSTSSDSVTRPCSWPRRSRPARSCGSSAHLADRSSSSSTSCRAPMVPTHRISWSSATRCSSKRRTPTVTMSSAPPMERGRDRRRRC